MSKYRWIYTTWPNTALAEAAAQILVEEALCACANILPGMRSVYRWQGAVETADEAVMILKTTAAKAPELMRRLIALHPFETPCVIALSPDEAASAPGFLAWIDETVGRG